MKKSGVIRLDITLTALAILMIAGFFAWSYRQEKIQTRDALRLADIRQIQAAFELMFRNYHTYEPASCQAGDLVSQCDLGAYLPEIKNIQDPGKFRYQISVTPDQRSYTIIFTLEKSYQGILKGEHSLSEKGIQ